MLVEEVGDNGVNMMRAVMELLYSSRSMRTDVLTRETQIKFALDPYCLLNPDKVFRIEPDV